MSAVRNYVRDRFLEEMRSDVEMTDAEALKELEENFFSERGLMALEHVRKTSHACASISALWEDSMEFNQLSDIVLEDGSFDCLSLLGRKAFFRHYSSAVESLFVHPDTDIPLILALDCAHYLAAMKTLWTKDFNPVSEAFAELTGGAYA